MGLLCGVGRPAKLALHRRGQNRGGRKLGGLRRAPRWLAVPARERHSELPRRCVNSPRRWGAGVCALQAAAARGPGAQRRSAEPRATRVLAPAPTPPSSGEPPLPAGGGARRPSPRAPSLRRAPLLRLAPLPLRARRPTACELLRRCCPLVRPLDAASPRRAPTCPARSPAVSSAARRPLQAPGAPCQARGRRCSRWDRGKFTNTNPGPVSPEALLPPPRPLCQAATSTSGLGSRDRRGPPKRGEAGDARRAAAGEWEGDGREDRRRVVRRAARAPWRSRAPAAILTEGSSQARLEPLGAACSLRRFARWAGWFSQKLHPSPVAPGRSRNSSYP